VKVSGSLQFRAYRASVPIAIFWLALSFSALPQDKPAAPAPVTPSAAEGSSGVDARDANHASFSYDVVSIRPYKPEDGRISVWGRQSPDGFTDQGDTLVSLLNKAYPILTFDQFDGLPHWGLTDYYNVEAKMGEASAAALEKLTQDQQRAIRRLMMQAVLADRFKLKVHIVSRELPVYNLVVSKGGPKFKETPAGKEDSEMLGWGDVSGDGIVFDQGILGNLSSGAGRFVVNKTGLTGRYSFSLKWNPLAGHNVPAGMDDQFSGRTDIFTAVQQIGLKFEPAKGPVDVYVIDHVEEPSPN
jgi:uncharacterized protein (TIGR03435 family)